MPELPGRSSLVEWAREIGEEHPFVDFHIHPFDVLTGDTAYQDRNPSQGLFSKGLSRYRMPLLVSKTESFRNCSDHSEAKSSERALSLASRFVYAHTGPRVFADQLDLVGISSAVMLPVVREPDAAENMLEAMAKMFSNDRRFMRGCPFPVGIPCNELEKFFQRACDTWGVRAIKIHPNLINIDPASTPGQDLMEATLEAGGNLGLPIVLHGGRTPGLEPIEKREYGTLPHLEKVDWGISSAPVVLAHSGCYGLADEELPSAFELLDGLLEKHSNLLVDTSNLGHYALQELLTSVDRSRLVFGSDALYVPIWKSWIRFLETLQLLSPKPENDLIRIASTNPSWSLSFFEQKVRA